MEVEDQGLVSCRSDGRVDIAESEVFFQFGTDQGYFHRHAFQERVEVSIAMRRDSIQSTPAGLHRSSAGGRILFSSSKIDMLYWKGMAFPVGDSRKAQSREGQEEKSNEIGSSFSPTRTNHVLSCLSLAALRLCALA